MQIRVQVRRTRTARWTLMVMGLTLAVTLAAPGRALAQPPPAPAAQAPQAPQGPPPVWTGSFGAGLAVTNGNSDTSNLNLTTKVTYDPMNPHLATLEALYLRGSNEGETNVARTALNVRDDYSFTERASVFGQFRYLRDTFKGIDYLAAPTVGIGYKVVNLERTKFNIDAGAGVVWEKNSDVGTVNTSGAVTVGENVTHNLTATTVFTHAATGLWKAADFGDALYTLSAGITAAVTARTQLKVEVLELYKSQPPVGLQSQDVSFLTSVVYSF